MEYGPNDRAEGNGATRPPVLVFADSPARSTLAQEAVRRAGGRAVAAGGIDGAIPRIDRQAGMAAVVVEVENADGDGVETLLRRLADDLARSRYAAVVTIPPALIDMAVAALGDGDAYLLSEPDPLQREVAVGLALAPPVGGGVRDVDLHMATHRLQELSDETARIARTLAALSRDLPAAMIPPPGDSAPVTAAGIRAILRARRARDRFFPGELFADPAWDMLLDLMAARLEEQPVSVSSLCIAAAVPPTTGLRWIKALTEQGLFRRVADRRDGRRVHIELSDTAADALHGYLSSHLSAAI